MTRAEIATVIGYVRVSTAEQGDSGAGLEAQRRLISQKCSEKSWQLLGDEPYQDVASGKSLNGRHQLKRALADLKAKKAHGLVVAKLDRLSRSIIDFAGILELSRKQGWHVILLDLDLDTSTPMGEAMANVAMTFAQLERRMIGVRTKDALAVKRSQGVRLGRPRQIPVETERKIVRLRAKGCSYEVIAAMLNDQGVPTASGRPWIWTSVKRVVERHPAKVS